MNTHKIVANITIEAPYRRPGNNVMEKPVSFDIYKVCHFKAIPLLSQHERKVLNLPAEILLKYIHGKIVSDWSPRDGKINIVEDLVQYLMEHPQYLCKHIDTDNR